MWTDPWKFGSLDLFLILGYMTFKVLYLSFPLSIQTQFLLALLLRSETMESGTKWAVELLPFILPNVMAHCALFQGLMAADEKLGKTMFFPLAERMVVKFINENKVDAEAGTVHVLPFLGIIINYLYYGNSKSRYFSINTNNWWNALVILLREVGYSFRKQKQLVWIVSDVFP